MRTRTGGLKDITNQKDAPVAPKELVGKSVPRKVR